ncbi:sigma-54 dependent transcriptional regulator [Bilophila sp.]|uniref:sigma-54 interaction domain-containing protein n=1 Tax=Bilophila sp. TaxID=1929485 RepID=UPI003077C03C
MPRPLNRSQAVLVTALHAAGRPLLTQELAVLAGKPQEAIASFLEPLLGAGLVVRAGGPDAWACPSLPDAVRDGLARLVARNASPDSLTHALARLGSPDMALDDCTAIAEAIGKGLGKRRPGSIICMECALRFLIAWGERHLHGAGGVESCLYGKLALTFQSMCILANRHIPLAFRLSSIAYELAGYGGNERFRPLIGILKNYMRLISLELPDEPWDISEVEVEFLRLKDACEQEMKNHIACFAGLLYAISGDYPDSLRSHVHQGEPGDWLDRIALFHAMSISQSAMYLGRYTLAVGTVESARHSAELAGEKTFSLLWLTHLCFLLLRKGDWDDALNHLDFLFSCTHPVENPKIFSSTVRGLALYHYLNGRPGAAYRILRRETENAIAAGSPHSPFVDPYILDMLYDFAKAGYPDIPRYAFRDTLESFLRSPNRQRRGAALRVKALCLRDGKAGRWDAEEADPVSLLRQSIGCLAPSQDVRELALARHELANTLESLGRHDEARPLRMLVSESIGRASHAGMSPLEISILATRDRDSDVFSPGVPTVDTRFLKEELMDRCHDAFNDVPIRQTLEDNLQRIVNVAQLELKAERAALFRPSAGGHPIECAASVNLTRTELQSPSMRDRIAWVADCLSKRKGDRERRAVCLSLNVGERQPWLLYLDTRFGPGFLTQLKKSELGELARLFAAEVRTALRLDDMRQQEIHWQNAKFNAVTLQKNTGEAPIIGEGLKQLAAQVRQVGMTDAAVLFYGETGTGKDVFARQLHLFSQRKGPFVAVHPASTPEQLFESEFFGHERGAFTGATSQKIGYVEMADGGTLFIDEVGEMPLSMQVKLLRVLQNQRFMRVGGTAEIISRFRLVAATNRNLRDEVAKGRFREDLFYRLSVVPLRVPPLRERREDIIGLAEAFVETYCQRYGRPPLQLTGAERACLLNYPWPGNVRELKNIIERAVILNAPLLELVSPSRSAASGSAAGGFTIPDFPTIPELEERYLRYVLEQTGGKVCGPDGAESLLRLKRSTIYLKLKKYGIIPSDFI